MPEMRPDKGRELRDDEARIGLNMIVTEECYRFAPDALRSAIWDHIKEQLEARFPQ